LAEVPALLRHDPRTALPWQGAVAGARCALYTGLVLWTPYGALRAGSTGHAESRTFSPFFP